MQNLSMNFGYKGSEQVAIDNGQGLNISNTGSFIVHSSPINSFKLTNILYVPAISSNLLSVNQFSKDNNCLFVFDSDSFSI